MTKQTIEKKEFKPNLADWFIINEIKQNKKTTIWNISKKYGLVYQQVKRVVDRLRKQNIIVAEKNKQNKRENFLKIKK